MRRTLTPIVAATAVLVLAGCGQQTTSEPSDAETTPVTDVAAEAADDDGSGTGECGPDHEPSEIDLNDETVWEDDVPPIACFGDAVTFTNGLTVTAEVPRTENLGDDGYIIMSDTEIPGAEVLAIDITLKNGSGSVLDTEGWDAPVGPDSYLIWAHDDETFEGQRVGNLNSADPGKAFPSRILPDTTATESRLYQMPGPMTINQVVFTLSTAGLADAADYDTIGTEMIWQGPLPDDVTLADENPIPSN